jgi:hypothetical protein
MATGGLAQVTDDRSYEKQRHSLLLVARRIGSLLGKPNYLPFWKKQNGEDSPSGNCQGISQYITVPRLSVNSLPQKCVMRYRVMLNSPVYESEIGRGEIYPG